MAATIAAQIATSPKTARARAVLATAGASLEASAGNGWLEVTATGTSERLPAIVAGFSEAVRTTFDRSQDNAAPSPIGRRRRAMEAAYFGAGAESRPAISPSESTLIVAGELPEQLAIQPFESAFGHWDASSSQATRSSTATPSRKIFFIDVPGSTQSEILATQRIEGGPNPLLRDALVSLLGSRINNNLREVKHWSYGASSAVLPGSLAAISSIVQADKTADAMREIVGEEASLTTPGAITPEVAGEAQRQARSRLSRALSSIQELAAALGSAVRLGDAPEAVFSSLAGADQELTAESLSRTVSDLFHPDQTVWFVIGDRSVLEPQLRALGWGDLSIVP